MSTSCISPGNRSANRLPHWFLAVSLLCFWLTVTAVSASNPADLAPDDDITPADLTFVREKIQPLLESRCFKCHGDIKEPKGGLSLVSRDTMLLGGESGAAIVPEDADESLLIQAVRYEGYEMPPRTRLPAEEIELLARWVEMGAPWPASDSRTVHAVTKEPFPLEERKNSHWAWAPIQRPTIPSTTDQNWPLDEVDQFILHMLESKELQPAADTERRNLLRRISFDLTGLPPSLEELAAFENDSRPLQIVLSESIDRLLGSPQFGERWARHWLDLVRYADSLGHEFDYPLPHAWQYRDYVIRAWNADVPYDDFLKEHVAGDLLKQPRKNPESGFNESVIGTGFWYLGEDKHAPVDVRAEEAARVDNQLDVFSRAFLGLTVACAKCHDHKFDAISTQDYYALAGFMQSSRRRIHYLDRDGSATQHVNRISELRHSLESELNEAGKNVKSQTTQEAIVRTLMLDASSTTDETNAQTATAIVQWSSDHPTDPLGLLARLQESSSEQQMQELRRWAADTLKQERQFQKHKDSGLLFADFRNGLPAGWRTAGRAWQHDRTAYTAQSKRSQYRYSATEHGVTASLRPGVSSDTLGSNFRGILSSPTFELTHPEILVKVAGNKTRMRLVVDGYVMNEFSELLFKGLKQNIESGAEAQWIRMAQDTSRYIGHRCHIEFLDEGDGWFCVEEVQFAEEPGAPPKENSGAVSKPLLRLAQTFENNDSASVNSFARSYSEALTQSDDWPIQALRLGLLNAETLAEMRTSIEEWKDIAAKPVSVHPALVIQDGSPENEFIFVRGSHRNPGDIAPRNFLSALLPSEHAGFETCDGSGRLELAELMLSDENPFPARVMVNRIWRHLFGRGLVPSVDNFGVLGQTPSHPKLLDYLADEFRRDGWSSKRMIRRLMLTRAYRMSNRSTSRANETDPQNLFLSHANVRRLDAESIRDSMLQLSGRLDRTLYGKPIPIHLTQFMQGRGRPGQNGTIDGDGRRSIYQAVNRNFLVPFFQVFDTPTPASTVGARSESNVPAQALMLLNNEFVRQQAERWAQNILAEDPKSGRLALQTAWHEAISRLPTDEEIEIFQDFAEQQALAYGVNSDDPLRDEKVLSDVCHIILNQKEFLFLQ